MLHKIRHVTAKHFEVPAAQLLIKAKISPNAITLTGLAFAFISAYLISDTSINNNFLFASILLLLSGMMDLFDGAVARLSNKVTKLGAFIDSVSDRIGEIAIFLGTTIYFSTEGNVLGSSLALAALGGSLTVSYIRARAESLNIKCDSGFMTRPERIICLFIGILVANWWAPMLEIVMGILVILTIITSIHRFTVAAKQINKIK
mgnify:CR=1 FL=1